MTGPCQARPDRYGAIRCTACRVSWDRDDVAACPRQRQEAPVVREPFVSALDPDRFI